MLIHLLWDRFPDDVRRVNFDYYEPVATTAARSVPQFMPSLRHARQNATR